MVESINERRKARVSHLRWVAIAEMRVNPRAQRDFNLGWASELAADFDLEKLGFPVVNRRDGHYFIVDAQHRVAALKMIGWADQQVQCETYDGMSEAEEAEMYLGRNKRRSQSVFDDFRISITAEREMEIDIDRIVRANDLVISKSRNTAGAVSAVGTLRKVYDQAGAATLSRALRIIRDSFGDAGMEAPIIHGLGLVCQRYNGTLDDEALVTRLNNMHGGAGGLLGKAEKIRLASGNRKPQCVAAAVVDVVNAGRGGKKLAPWFREETA